METLRQYLLRIRREIDLKSPGDIEIFDEKTDLTSPGIVISYRNFKEIVATFEIVDCWRYLRRGIISAEWKKGIKFFYNHKFISEYYRCKIVLGRWPLGEAASVITRWNKYVKLIKGEDVK